MRRYQQSNYYFLNLFGYVTLKITCTYCSSARSGKGQPIQILTARTIIDDLAARGAGIAAPAFLQVHTRQIVYQLWQEGSHAELAYSEAVMRQKLDYIHHNPIKRGYVDLAEHWRYPAPATMQVCQAYRHPTWFLKIRVTLHATGRERPHAERGNCYVAFCREDVPRPAQWPVMPGVTLHRTDAERSEGHAERGTSMWPKPGRSFPQLRAWECSP